LLLGCHPSPQAEDLRCFLLLPLLFPCGNLDRKQSNVISTGAQRSGEIPAFRFCSATAPQKLPQSFTPEKPHRKKTR
jgi:hypothetical protein